MLECLCHHRNKLNFTNYVSIMTDATSRVWSANPLKYLKSHFGLLSYSQPYIVYIIYFSTFFLFVVFRYLFIELSLCLRLMSLNIPLCISVFLLKHIESTIFKKEYNNPDRKINTIDHEWNKINRQTKTNKIKCTSP